MIIFYVTCKDKREANKIARSLLKKRLIACANYFPIQSAYWWVGKITNDKEIVLILKTPEKNRKIIEEEIKKVHSYKIPCMIFFPVRANKEFEEWVKKETK